MALVYNKQLEGFDYILQSERGDAKPFTLKLKAIDSIELAKLQDGLLQRSDNSLSIRTGTYNVSVCRLAIIGWDNLLDDKKKQIKMKTTSAGAIADSSLNMIPADLFEEIASVAVSVSNDPTTLQLLSVDE